MGVPFDLPANLRTCADQVPLTDPEAIRTRGDLKSAYGDEYTAHIVLAACIRETVRLVDVHNEQMTTGKLAPK